MKAQSAVEYLTTYGWMLMAVAVVGGVIFSMFSQQVCPERASGFSIGSITVGDFGTTASSNNISLVVQNQKTSEAVIKRISFSMNGRKRSIYLNQEVDPGSKDVVTVPGFQQSDACNSISAKIQFEQGSLDDQRTTGELTANVQFDDTRPPLTPAGFEAGYPHIN